ncbi:MAG: hypothetical protein ACI3V2_05140 [Faecousia sp.]
MKKTWKRLFAFVLMIAMVFTMLPNAFAAHGNKPGRTAKEPSAADYAAVDEVWAEITAKENRLTAKRASAKQTTDAVIATVKASDNYVEGSLARNGDSFTWMTEQGIACHYSPRIREQMRSTKVNASFDPTAEVEVETISYAKRGGSPSSKDVYLIEPYYGIDSSFTTQYQTEAQEIASALGGTYTLYKTTNATIDNVANALMNGAVVIFDSHGSTDYASGSDYTSGATTSYLCLQSGTGITTEDYTDNHAYYAGSNGSMKYYEVDGTAIANHMTKSAPNSLLWMAICLGMATDGLQKPLRAKGVEVAYGYSQSVSFTYDYKWEASFFDSMIAGKTVAQAISTMKSSVGKWDYPSNYTTITSARNNYAAFPIVVSSEDTYPGHGNVDALQTVNSTYTFFSSTTTTCSHSSTSTAVTTAATCTASGTSTTTCNSCGAVVSTATIPATGHNYSNGYCTVCGAADPNYTAPSTGGSSSSGGKYTLVTSAPSDWSGNYVLVGVSGSTYYVLDASGSYTGTSIGSTSAAKTLSAAGITKSGNTLSGVSDDYVYAIEPSGSYYSARMKDSTNYLRYTANGLTTLSSLTYTSQQWTLSLSSTGAALMKNRAGSSYYLGFNASSKMFRCYTSTSSYKLYLYKEDTASSGSTTTCSHTSTSTAVTTAATCTTSGVSTTTCNSCGAVISTATIPATGHNYSNGYCTVCGAADPNYTAPSTGKTYTLVTSTPSDWSGEYVLVGKSGSTYYVLDASGSYTGTSIGSTSAAKTFSAAGITVSGNTLSGVSDNYVYAIEPSGSYYSVRMKNSTNYLRYKANGLTTLSSLTYTSQQWTLSLSSTGAALMKNRSGSSYYLGFNASAKLFRCYTSTSSYKLYLYKAN